jgi:hypothetical protein
VPFRRPRPRKPRELAGNVRQPSQVPSGNPAETDWLAAVSVCRELVSGAGFPANREKYREFSRFRGLAHVSGPNSDAFSATYAGIPCAHEQGISEGRTGNSIDQNRE